MRLKSLELQGFKSFPDATLLSFPYALTAIVGPNGSGKSNLSDAIRWVLGEQSAKTLRGGRMEDVIFGGAQDRPRQGLAQVTLTLENDRGEEPETAVTRRYYRSGESEYYLNGRQVRLKDVTDRFLDTGLGQDGYALIGQGRIDEILSAKSVQRREIFEEAAGIAHCRKQKEETQRKLDQAQDNLTRLRDKLEELQLQREPLREGAEKAKRYAALSEELRGLEVSLWLRDLEDHHRKGEKLKRDLDTAGNDLDRWQEETDSRYRQSEALLEELRLAQTDREGLEQRKSQTEARKQDREKTLALVVAQKEMGETTGQRYRDQRRSSQERKNALDQTETSWREEGEALKKSLSQARDALLTAQKEREDMEGLLREARAQREEALRGAGRELNSCRQKEKGLEETWLAMRMDTGDLKARVTALETLMKRYEGYGRGVRTAMESKLPGVLGPVGERFHVAAPYALALETALGGAVNHILVENEDTGKAVLRWVKERRGGRVTCLPLTALRPRTLGEKGIEQTPGYVAVAADLVDCDEKSRPAAQSLLGRTVVVEDLDHGVALAKSTGYRFPVVTLEGEILRPGGTMTGGSPNQSGALTRGAEALALQEAWKKAAEKEAQGEKALQTARKATQLAQLALDDLRKSPEELPSEGLEQAREKDREIQALAQEIARLEGALRAREPLEGQMAQQRTLLQREVRELAEREEALREAQEKREGQILDLNAQMDALAGELADLSQEVQTASRQVLALEARRTKLEREAREGNDTLLRLQREYAALENKHLQSQGEEKRILDRLWDTYGLTHQGAQRLQVPLDGTAGRRVGKIRDEIRKLGPVNPTAVEEFRRVEERYTFLKDQKDDVETAKAKLEGVMGDISEEMAEVFLTEFRKIQRAFRQTFSLLFGGGRGELVLEDPEKPLETGVDIQVQPPGKTLRSLTLLSGGERALVAIALYFAMVRVHPTPFCVVDEIEAALDEANSVRFANCLKDMAGDTQFLLITHRRTTMEAAQMLYGVTMEQQGVSRVLRLDLEQIEEVLGEELEG